MELFINNSPILKPVVYTVKRRVKSNDSLRDKLTRKMLEAKAAGTAFAIAPDNLLTEINDLAGLRILHINRSQIVEINQGLREIVAENQLKLIEVFARTGEYSNGS